MEVFTPAKLNLYLRVLRRRPDGYHDLVSLMVPIDMYDRMEIELAAGAVQLRCPCGLPEDSRNLAYRAATLFLLQAEARGIQAGTRIFMEKHIPVAAGLGGGSSDAAAVLLTLNELCGEPFTNAELQGLGLRLGADVPFFILGGPAIACGVGERLQSVEVPKRWYVLINPRFPVKTKEVYENLRLTLTPVDEATIVKSLGGLITDPAMLLCNDLERSTFSLFPELERLKHALRAAGAEGSLMSGSGPTVFGVFNNEGAAMAAAEQLRTQDSWAVSVHSGPSPMGRKGDAHGSDRGTSLPGQRGQA
jgi:4-diphosphocytidyl-2-C-methyl-D-erythritol kinase